jgi:site-specific DNA-methyltransferase (adenine-specific)
MKIYAEDKQYKLYEGQMQEVLDSLPENSVDAIICDPPYDLISIGKRFGKPGSAPCSTKNNDGSFARLSRGFMGKTWDGTGVAFKKETWEHCLRVLKDGGYLLAFGGTRTFHRMACAIEDAGFEIRDTLMWLYGSGFPKSLNIGLAVDKLNGVESKVIAEGKSGSADTHTRTMKSITDNGKDVFGGNYEIKQAQNEWRGWGTALKPAYEPIIVARKQMKTSVAENVLKNRVGGINIDECRVGTEDISVHNAPKGTFAGGEYDRGSDTESYREHTGRFPANIIHDGSNEVANGMPTENDVSAMRYFYCAKASKKDRDGGLDMFEEKQTTDGCIRENSETARKFGANSALRKNVHPTVKPCELMQYLIRLVAPKGSVVMDCFMGSGSTGKATMFENRERNANYYFIGIEMTSEYLPICKARIDYAINLEDYEARRLGAPISKQVNVFDD